VRRVTAPYPALAPITLAGRYVVLEPLSTDHVDDLVRAATQDRSSYGYTHVPDTVGSMTEYVDRFVAARSRGTDLPFAQRRVTDGRVVGCTRYLDVTWWPDRADPVEVEIGGTWLAADAQRSPVNTEAKLLLLGHAFETWHVHRVAICTDRRNERSRAAIERLGASLDGILRNHRPTMGAEGIAGTPRDTAVYSILPDEWPAIRRRLVERLDR
jgi:RimJ/RimL family protein N-acetyltransferase